MLPHIRPNGVSLRSEPKTIYTSNWASMYHSFGGYSHWFDQPGLAQAQCRTMTSVLMRIT
jgi:hypothetical protein